MRRGDTPAWRRVRACRPACAWRGAVCVFALCAVLAGGVRVCLVCGADHVPARPGPGCVRAAFCVGVCAGGAPHDALQSQAGVGPEGLTAPPLSADGGGASADAGASLHASSPAKAYLATPRPTVLPLSLLKRVAGASGAGTERARTRPPVQHPPRPSPSRDSPLAHAPFNLPGAAAAGAAVPRPGANQSSSPAKSLSSSFYSADLARSSRSGAQTWRGPDRSPDSPFTPTRANAAPRGAGALTARAHDLHRDGSGGKTPWLPLAPGQQVADLHQPVLERARAAFDHVWNSHLQIVKDSTDVYERHTLSVQYEERLAQACREATASLETDFAELEDAAKRSAAAGEQLQCVMDLAAEWMQDRRYGSWHPGMQPCRIYTHLHTYMHRFVASGHVAREAANV